MKYILLVVLICISSLANAQSNRQRLDDIEDKLDFLILQRQYDEIDKLVKENEKMRSELNSSSQQLCINPNCYSYKRKYYNGSCKLIFIPNKGFVEVPNDIPNNKVLMIASNDNKVKIDLFVDKNWSNPGSELFVKFHSYEMYQMCK